MITCSDWWQHLAALGVVVVVVGVEEVADGGGRHLPNLGQHQLRVLHAHRVNHHDAVLSRVLQFCQ